MTCGEFRISGDLSHDRFADGLGFIQSARMRSWGDSVRLRGARRHVGPAIWRAQFVATTYYQSLRNAALKRKNFRRQSDSCRLLSCDNLQLSH